MRRSLRAIAIAVFALAAGARAGLTWRRIALCASLTACRAQSEVVALSTPDLVADAPLLDGEFSEWNFGGSPLLEVGYMGGIYTEHRATSAIRFDLRHVRVSKTTQATLRLYKPKDFVQLRPIRVSVHPVTRGWEEGADIFGAKGVQANVAAESKPVASAIAPDDHGAWVEFTLPAELVQRWLDDPTANHGVLLAVAPDEQKQWGDHVYFYSSEHWSNQTPQLIIEGEGVPTNRTPGPAKSRLVQLPAERSLDPWLRKNGRLAKFAKNLRCTPEQARVLQIFDTTVRDDFIVARYQRPFHDTIAQIPALIERGDDKALRQRLDTLHELLLKWEYIRETMWYTSGPLADVLSPRQLNHLFAGEIFGNMESSARDKGREIWKVLPPEKMQAHNRAVVNDLADRLKLSPDQARALAPKIAEYETEEYRYLALFRPDLARCQQLMKENADGPAVFDAVRRLHLHHERFLFYQSIYNTPRWTLFMRHAPVGPFAAWIADARQDHYGRAVTDARKRADESEEN